MFQRLYSIALLQVVNMLLKKALLSLLLSSIAVDAAIDDTAHLRKALAASRKQTPVEEQPVIAKRQSEDTPFLNSNTTSMSSRL